MAYIKCDKTYDTHLKGDGIYINLNYIITKFSDYEILSMISTRRVISKYKETALVSALVNVSLVSRHPSTKQNVLMHRLLILCNFVVK